MGSCVNKSESSSYVSEGDSIFLTLYFWFILFFDIYFIHRDLVQMKSSWTQNNKKVLVFILPFSKRLMVLYFHVFIKNKNV